MAQIKPKTILQTYLEHQGLNQLEQRHQKCQKQSRSPAALTNESIGWQPVDCLKKKLVEPVELIAHPVDQLRKILKFWHNVPWRIRNPIKKRCVIPSSDNGEMTKTSQCVLSWSPTELRLRKPQPLSHRMIRTKESTMTTLHNGPNACTKLDRRWTHMGSKNRLSPTKAPWSWHTRIEYGRHPQDICKWQWTKLRIYTNTNQEHTS